MALITERRHSFLSLNTLISQDIAWQICDLSIIGIGSFISIYVTLRRPHGKLSFKPHALWACKFFGQTLENLCPSLCSKHSTGGFVSYIIENCLWFFAFSACTYWLLVIRVLYVWIGSAVQYSVIGCYRDSSPRDLPTETMTYSGTTVTLENCAQSCFDFVRTTVLLILNSACLCSRCQETNWSSLLFTCLRLIDKDVTNREHFLLIIFTPSRKLTLIACSDGIKLTKNA